MCVPPGWIADPEEQLSNNNNNNNTKASARVYPFELDPFQKVAVACIEKRHSVLVSAHTSAGKTVVAEYAIASALRDQQRVIYTSPIKALSNQKFRDLAEIFQDVGLMTGDITINPSASCLVMTTEILRSMLYRGSEILREIGWVIFDEIHYMRDKERGVVWEETIILLPDTIKLVFLSATIPNAREFANWIAQIHNQPCHVVYTDYRPTPLQHYVFPSGGNGLYLVVDEKRNFREENFQNALSALVPNSTVKKADIYKIVKVIIERHYEPVIVFAFSKKDCETLALQIAKLDFNNDAEKQLVDSVFNNAIDILNEEDKKLPQICEILPLLKKGIGIHHSGLLPLLKEVIEILFQEGLIKCLFATETFSMGLNMPAKTVVFTATRKFDGKNFRYITGGEYIQMSGRAGRRGIDDRGIVILMVDEKMEPQLAQDMLKGQSDVLYSQFHLGYNMLLNLLRIEGIDPLHMLKQSFHQFQNDREIPSIKKRMEILELQLKSVNIPNEKVVAEYYSIRRQLEVAREEVRKIIHHPSNSLSFLSQGRLVRVRDGGIEWGWGVVVNLKTKQTKGTEKDESDKTTGPVVDVLLACESASGGENRFDPPKPHRPGNNKSPDLQVIPLPLDHLDGISYVRIFIPKDLTSLVSRQSVAKTLEEVIKRFPDGIPLLDPIEDMKIENPTFTQVVRHIEVLEQKLFQSKFTENPDLLKHVEKYMEKVELEKEMKQLKKKLTNTDNVILQDELKYMKRVLRRLGYLSKDNVVQLKGRVAADMNTTDELVLTELLFSGFFTELTTDQIVGILSCFVYEGEPPKGSGIALKSNLVEAFRQLKEIARRIATVAKESKLPVDVEEYVGKFSPALIDVAYSWCQGATFAEICTMTSIFEGSIIRSMRGLEEILRQVNNAAKTIGNTELENKVTEGMVKIKRDIIFAASLYL